MQQDKPGGNRPVNYNLVTESLLQIRFEKFLNLLRSLRHFRLATPFDESISSQREKNAQASMLASKIADGTMVHYLDIGSQFLNSDGTIAKEIMPDFLHLSPRGYEIWADAIEPMLKALMAEKAGR